MINARGRLLASRGAEALNLSRSRFSRVFSRDVGVSFREAQRMVRLEMSALVVIESRLRFSEIAQIFGYSLGSKGSEAFHKHFHRSPSCYRREHGYGKNWFDHGFLWLSFDGYESSPIRSSEISTDLEPFSQRVIDSHTRHRKPDGPTNHSDRAVNWMIYSTVREVADSLHSPENRLTVNTPPREDISRRFVSLAQERLPIERDRDN